CCAATVTSDAARIDSTTKHILIESLPLVVPARYRSRFGHSSAFPRSRLPRLDGAVSPRERHRLSDHVFISQIQPHGRASLASPGAALGREGGRVVPNV